MQPPELPAFMRDLPVDHIGRPVPWFVAWIDGEPDFRVIAPRKPDVAAEHRLCWVCGKPYGKFGTFVIGPMCAVNRISAEPPSHRECATYSALACPFLSRPNMVRREGQFPEDAIKPAGIMIRRNPGTTLLWTTRRYEVLHEPNGLLFQIGDPERVDWYANGRLATREQVLESIESGMPILRAEADRERQRTAANRELTAMYEAALQLVPA